MSPTGSETKLVKGASERRGVSNALRQFPQHLSALAVILIFSAQPAHARCQYDICIDVAYPKPNAFFVTLNTSITGVTHYNIRNSPKNQFEVGGNVAKFDQWGPPGTTERFSVQACRRGGLFKTSTCSRWADFEETFGGKPAQASTPLSTAEEPSSKPTRVLGKKASAAAKTGAIGQIGKLSDRVPAAPAAQPEVERFVTVKLDTDVYGAPAGAGQSVAILRAGTQQVKLIKPCSDNWCNLSWPAGNGWVWSGPGHQSLEVP